MPNRLGEKILEVSEEFRKTRKSSETFLDYYADYVGRHFYIEKIKSDEIILFIDEQLEVIPSLSLEEQNKKIETLSTDLKHQFIEKDWLTSPLSFDGLHFLALTMLGRIKNDD